MNQTGFKPTIGYCAVFILAVLLALVVQGAVPGIAIPTLGQAVWSSGFAMSFADSFPPGLVATHFGAPQPAPIAFGLAGAYPIALLISAGLHPADAYSTMVAIWITVAFVAAWRIALRLQVGPYLSILAAFFWLSMPIIWVHARYSMLSLGFALLPFYFLAAFMLLDSQRESIGRRLAIAAYYVVACQIAIFMDGYTFMMFAVGSSLLFLGGFFSMPGRRRHLLSFVAPVHVLAFGAAYLAFSAYIGVPEFTRDDMTFFRAWGADITFFLWPSRYVLWLWDALGLSELRAQDRFFGDESVWISTFILPLVLVGLAGWFATRRKTWLATAALVIALVGLYLSLGPSFKFYSTQPTGWKQIRSCPRSGPWGRPAPNGSSSMCPASGACARSIAGSGSPSSASGCCRSCCSPNARRAGARSPPSLSAGCSSPRTCRRCR